MTDPTWTIHGADYDVVVDGLLGEFIDRRRGESATLRFEIRRRGTTGSNTGGQYSGPYGFRWSGPQGAQYSGGRTVAAADTRYERLVAYHDFAGATNTAVDDKRVPYYRESLPQRANVSSLLIGVEPNGDISPATGVWAIVTGGGERSRLFADSAVVELEVVVLAEYPELTRSEVKTQFEEPL